MKSYCVRWDDDDGTVCFKAQLTHADATSLSHGKFADFVHGMELIARSLQPHEHNSVLRDGDS